MDRFTVFANALQSETAKPYAYGKADCFFLALGVWDALTDGKRRKRYAGRYTTLKGAQRALRKEGHTSLVSFFSDDLEQIAPAFAQPGDIAVLDLDEDGKLAEHCAVFTGTDFLTKRLNGVTRHGFDAVKAAFRVA